MLLKKFFLFFVLGIIIPFATYAENECVLNGGECLETTSCDETLNEGFYDDSCLGTKVCCKPPKPTPTDDYYEEGTTGGFLLLQGHLVPCGRSTDDIGTTDINETQECTLCHLFIMLKNVFDLMISLLIVTAILFITIGGVIYIVSAGNSNMTGLAKEIIKKTLIGFALMLAGWLLVYTLLVFLSAGENSMVGSGGKWYEFNCDLESSFQGEDGIISEKESSIRSLLSENNIEINKLPPATQVADLTEETIQDLISFQSKYGSDLVVTGGSENSGGHAPGIASHGSGQKVDLRLNDSLDNYIRTNFTPFNSSRSDVSEAYKDGNGNYYYLENDHWDVCYGSDCTQS